MTLFFTAVAAIHIFGLFALLVALRRTPIAVEADHGFRVIADPEETREIVAGRVRTA